MTSTTTDRGGRPELEIGRVVKPHGLDGELVVDLWTNVPGRLASGASFETGAGALTVETVRPHGGRYLVRFAGIAGRSAAEGLRGTVLRAPAAALEDALFVHELIDARVVTSGGRTLGRVVSVEANPASDLLVLEDGTLVPLRFVTSFEPGDVVSVDVPEGLVD